MKRYSDQQFNATLVMCSQSKGIAAINGRLMDVRVCCWSLYGLMSNLKFILPDCQPDYIALLDCC